MAPLKYCKACGADIEKLQKPGGYEFSYCVFCQCYEFTEELEEVTQILAKTLQWPAVHMWYDTGNEKLGGKTPWEYLKDTGNYEKLKEIALSYFDTTYG